MKVDFSKANLRQEAIRRGLNPKTVFARKQRGWDTEEKLYQKPQNRGKPIKVEGRTFLRWQTYFAIRGVERSIKYFQNFYYKHRKEGMTDKQIVSKMKKANRIDNNEKKI